jgi:translation initiation factor IF-3
VRLVGVENEPLGIVKLADAFRMSEQQDVDLVEIAPQAVPPVCRLMDYGKFKYQEAKKQHEAKLKQKVIQVKEVKFRPGTDDGDYNVKLRNLIRFLEDGDKTKITLRFRGREMAHQEIGMRMLERLRTDLDEVGAVEQMPKMEGRQMIMVLGPKKKKQAAIAHRSVRAVQVVSGICSLRRRRVWAVGGSGRFRKRVCVAGAPPEKAAASIIGRLHTKWSGFRRAGEGLSGPTAHPYPSNNGVVRHA